VNLSSAVGARRTNSNTKDEADAASDDIKDVKDIHLLGMSLGSFMCPFRLPFIHLPARLPREQHAHHCKRDTKEGVQGER
jgi:hypothetical protein